MLFHPILMVVFMPSFCYPYPYPPPIWLLGPPSYFTTDEAPSETLTMILRVWK